MATAAPGAPAGVHVVRQEPVAPDAGPVVVVVHGGMDRASSFGRVVRHLPGIEVVRYDRRGYGRSVEAGPTDLDGHVADLLAIVGDRPTVVFGHSVGGVIALVAAERRPDAIRAVLAYEAPTPWAPWWPSRHRDPEQGLGDPADEAERFMRRMVGDRIWDRLPARTRADRRAEGGALRADLASLDLDAPPVDLPSFPVPLVSAAGTASSWWHRRGSEELAAAVPTGTFVSVEGADHGVHLGQPARTADLVALARDLARP
ncbi:alpha/beta hydrolase [Aquihabitans sp. G128]|uniref:alpha/beta fold hydrolase n=1 Tax=Aquihabitans sp. G128 TaxID=2849779 RepID=UPI001C24BE43|nr:alpha/beta fold hydrolase [Aquihabitans sp. G128]QXC62079.1 alpha/beta hydrolase [Aquihabitans sp. G128]